jgi:predicted DNA-binding transcriptional regulator YafY
MSRVDRLMDLLDRLRGAEETTVHDLASDMDVSARTIHRDIAALRSRGYPIRGDTGPGGGIRFDGARGVTAVHLTLSEVVTLWLSTRLSQAASDLPWSGAASSALSKMLASLPRARVQELRAVCRRVIIGPPSSVRISAAAGQPPPELLRLFEEAFTAMVGLGFQYCDRHGNETVRHVEPHGLLVQTPVWYVLARDIEKAEPRMFRMDRISRPRLLEGVRFRADSNVIRELLCDGGDAWRPLLGALEFR